MFRRHPVSTVNGSGGFFRSYVSYNFRSHGGKTEVTQDCGFGTTDLEQKMWSEKGTQGSNFTHGLYIAMYYLLRVKISNATTDIMQLKMLM
jgi:hypothetical protein